MTKKSVPKLAVLCSLLAASMLLATQATALCPTAGCIIGGCYQYSTVTVIAGPTTCKELSGGQNTADAYCTSNSTTIPHDSIEVYDTHGHYKVVSTTKSKYVLSGDLGPEYFSLSAGYELEKMLEITCEFQEGEICADCPHPQEAHWCKEYWEPAQITTKRQAMNCCYGDFWDFGECEPGITGCSFDCNKDGTLKVRLTPGCGQCSTLPVCGVQ